MVKEVLKQHCLSVQKVFYWKLSGACTKAAGKQRTVLPDISEGFHCVWQQENDITKVPVVSDDTTNTYYGQVYAMPPMKGVAGILEDESFRHTFHPSASKQFW